MCHFSTKSTRVFGPWSLNSTPEQALAQNLAVVFGHPAANGVGSSVNDAVTLFVSMLRHESGKREDWKLLAAALAAV